MEGRRLRILFIGDVVGQSGLDVVRQYLPKAISEWDIELTIINGENSAEGGFGITESAYNTLLSLGADAVTLGNHSWARKEALEFIDRAPRLIRPINYLPDTPGRGGAFIESRNGRRAMVINALGRLFMDPIDDRSA
jgi:calcineurin-like phosphoesterase